MADGDSCSPPPAKKVKSLKCLNSVERMMTGMDDLFGPAAGLMLLNITHCNGAEPNSFTQAVCSTVKYPAKFAFGQFFQTTIKEAAETYPNVPDSTLFQNLLNVLENGPEIARKFKSGNDKKQETAYTVQLSHHLLTPLSLNKDYIVDQHSRNQTETCFCCKEKITGSFDDTSLGYGKVWHGSTDILIGKEKDVSVAVSIEEEKEEEEVEDYWPTQSDTHMEQCKPQCIAKTIVFGFLRLKMKESDLNSLIPTITMSENYFKVYFYDAHHDFLLESPPMPLFIGDHEDLVHSTVIALWLVINYRVTCTGLTNAVVKTGFRANFMKQFNEEVKALYREKLHFRKCIKIEDVYVKYGLKLYAELSEPYDKGFVGITSENLVKLRNQGRNVWFDQ